MYNRLIDKLFTILRNNKQLLKHQFKTLNIGMRLSDENNDTKKCDIFSWNSSIDDKFIDSKEQCWKELGQRELDPQADQQNEITFSRWKDNLYDT